MSAIHLKVYKISGERLWSGLIVLDFSIIEPAHWELFWYTPMLYVY